MIYWYIFINLIILLYAFKRWITSSRDASSIGNVFFLLVVLWGTFLFWVGILLEKVVK